MKIFITVFFAAVFVAAVASDEQPKCHNCLDFPADDIEQAKMVLSEWLDEDCVCKNENFQRHEIKEEGITVYCCDKRRLQKWKGWKKIGDAISNAVKTILSNTNVNVNVEKKF